MVLKISAARDHLITGLILDVYWSFLIIYELYIWLAISHLILHSLEEEEALR